MSGIKADAQSRRAFIESVIGLFMFSLTTPCRMIAGELGAIEEYEASSHVIFFFGSNPYSGMVIFSDCLEQRHISYES
jgi:hypothetical protein